MAVGALVSAPSQIRRLAAAIHLVAALTLMSGLRGGLDDEEAAPCAGRDRT